MCIRDSYKAFFSPPPCAHTYPRHLILLRPDVYKRQGPLILTASSRIQKQMEKGKKLILQIDLKPALTAEQLDKRLLREFDEAKNKQFKNSVGSLFPAKLIPVMVERSGILPEKKVNEISREERQNFVRFIKRCV